MTAKAKTKDKPVKVELIQLKQGGSVTEPYRILEDVRSKHHSRLVDCQILLLWRREWKPDKNGRLTLGQARKASDTDRELNEHELRILLNKEAWERLTSEQRAALLDHELSHCEVEINDDGSVRTDEKGRPVCRLRKHDLEEFRGVVTRHGMYLDDIRDFVAAAMGKAGGPDEEPGLFDESGEGTLP